MTKLLIVEDDMLLSKMYQKIFESEGYEVVMVANGEEGLVKINEFKPTFIILDIMIPKLNGLQVLEKLKSNSETKNIPVLVLTNLSGEQEAQKALALGAIKYVIKSDHKPKEVEAIVRDIIISNQNVKIEESSSSG